MNFNKGLPGDYAYGVFTGQDYFDPRCVANLNAIVKATNAKFVLSSSWRMLFDMETMVDFLKHQKVTGELIDYTNRFYGDRGHEIQEWLDRHPEIESFVILDDDEDMVHLTPRLVRTTWEKGLEEHHVEQAIALLNKKFDANECPRNEDEG